MNTSAVAKLLGVSPSTVQRWVRQLELQMERNELGHYLFKEEDIDLLKQVQDQLSKGMILQNVNVHDGKSRRGIMKTTVSINDKAAELIMEKVEMLEQRLNGKADDVVSYQLLQHRREIEDLQEVIKSLTERIEKLESKQNSPKTGLPAENLLIFDKEVPKKKAKRKNIITSLFGF
ncbi:MerR family transcriptional regulator [Bacillus sp. S/N-304-OC-R1]|uniref:MerR family transcriptional regulator n=1 Tax=Bacillus sp. S/N-304-OC-R1 TaxID=2758034 RepID=UPI001C8D0824|nr:MerR family transcriptional regulator [Bacillus sp. S/N-304-OC-R1]MBY0124276.1 MerR family transcriptional regulator [Bacillus sp. S/N-304-OC-R1]